MSRSTPICLMTLLALALTLLPVAAPPAPAAAQAQDFVALDELPASEPPAAGDLDNDGDLDLVLGSTDGRLQLYFNAGNGTFAAGPELSTGTSSGQRPFVGDVNGDGRLDIVGGNQVFINNRQAYTASALPAGGRAFALGDLDGDGDLDVLVARPQALLQVYRNTGAGAFAAGPELPNSETVSSVVLGDLDADGVLDYAFNGGRVIFNDGAGGASREYQAPVDFARDVAFGDMNSDGSFDIIVWSPGNIAIIHNTGAGYFAEPVLLNISLTESLTVADFDSDGDLDLALGYICTRHCGVYQLSEILMSDGYGSFREGQSLGPYSYYGVEYIVAGDFDNDYGIDLVLGVNKTFVFGNRLAAAMVRARAAESTSNGKVLAVGDLNGDQRLDLVSGDQVLLNTGEGSFARGVAFPGEPDVLAVGDLNGDGHMDAVVEGTVYLNSGTAAFSASDTLDLSPSSLVLGDLNGDGRLDLLADNRVYLNVGEGRFTFSKAIGSASTTAALGDVDGDGDLDILLTLAGNTVQLFKNNGSAQFTPGPQVSAGGPVSALALGDLNADGSLDLAIGILCPSDAQCRPSSVFMNDGTGRFTLSGPIHPAALQTWSLSLGDVNLDGHPDILLGSNWGITSGGRRSQIYHNDGSGRFSPGPVIENSPYLYLQQTALADMDNDGDLDVVIKEGEYASILENHRSPHPQLPANAVRVAVQRPGKDRRGGGFSSATIHSGPVIEVPFGLLDQEGEPVRDVRAWYSLDGGGVWRIARPAAGRSLTNLHTLRERYRAPIGSPVSIGDLSTLASTLTVGEVVSFRPVQITDVKVRLSLEHGFVGDLRASLRGPDGTRVELFNRVGGGGANMLGLLLDDAAPAAITTGAAPFSGRFQPQQSLAAFQGRSPFGAWTLELADQMGGDAGRLLAWSLEIKTNGVTHLFPWDLAASEVTGFSDNVVVRIEAATGGAGPFRQAVATATSDPFRVRGLQPRALDTAGRPVEGALVYRLPASQEFGAALIPPRRPGLPQLATDANGYLQGRPPLAVGDRLVALRPVGSDGTVARFHTSAAPTETGLAMQLVQQHGAQSVVVRPSQPLMLLDLEVALEWDARRDTQFLSQLDRELRRASDLLFDWSDGQVALGAITVYHDRARWDDAHIRIYASNRLRPNAVKGGLVGAERADPSPAVAETYLPGQVRMGSVWNRFGEATSALSDDWARAFAHEIGHFALFLDDNYLGFDAAGRLVSGDACPGAMTDPYRDDFSEFHPDGGWGQRCASTLSQQSTGRSDWATIKALYDHAGSGFALNAPAAFGAQPGPARVPLAVTTISYVAPVSETVAIDPPVYLLVNPQGGLLSPLPGRGARAFLFQSRGAGQGGDRLVDLGRPVVDQVNARGAQPGDRVCVMELDRQRLGCRTVDAPNQQIRLAPVTDWRPDIRLTPVNSATLDLEVRGLSPGLAMRARLYPGSGPASPEATLAATGGSYRLRIERPASAPAFEGLLHLWVEETGQRRETVVDFRTGGNPGKGWARTAPRSNPGKGWARTAPVLSSDGQAIVFSPDTSFAEGQFFTLMASDSPPAPPGWATPVSRAYRLSATPGAGFAQLSLNIGYLGDEVPGSQEPNIVAYYWNEAQSPPRWEALESQLDPERNEVAAAIARPGLYQLMTSLALPLDRAGWNLVPSYPGATQPLAQALGGSDGRFTTLYGYDSARVLSPWQLFDVDVPGWVNDLDQLRAGESYWIRTVRPTSLPVRGPGALGAGPAQNLTLPPPPATYYGALPAALAGSEVVATVGGAVCGRSSARRQGELAVFVVHVEAAGAGQLAGCGAFGREVLVTVGGTRLTAPWRNERPQPLTPGLAGPRPDSFVYLPVLRR